MGEENRMFADTEKWSETGYNKDISYNQITRENAGIRWLPAGILDQWVSEWVSVSEWMWVEGLVGG